jgi:hypothetical protein
MPAVCRVLSVPYLLYVVWCCTCCWFVPCAVHAVCVLAAVQGAEDPLGDTVDGLVHEVVQELAREAVEGVVATMAQEAVVQLRAQGAVCWVCGCDYVGRRGGGL